MRTHRTGHIVNVSSVLGKRATPQRAAYSASKAALNALTDALRMELAGSGVGVTLVWSAVVAFFAYKIVDLTVGLRVPEEEEREGLDITSHGESAYHY